MALSSALYDLEKSLFTFSSLIPSTDLGNASFLMFTSAAEQSITKHLLADNSITSSMAEAAICTLYHTTIVKVFWAWQGLPPCHAYIYTTNNTDQVLNRERLSRPTKVAELNR